MLGLTKIFHFEMAHAIYGYPGHCKNIHGHSYELHDTVTPGKESPNYLQGPGYIMDFTQLKSCVMDVIIAPLDHQLVLSPTYISNNPAISTEENLFIFDSEATTENLLIYIKDPVYDSSRRYNTGPVTIV